MAHYSVDIATPHTLTFLDTKNDDLVQEMCEFAQTDACPGDYCFYPEWAFGSRSDDTIVFVFSDPNAALAFKLRWV